MNELKGTTEDKQALYGSAMCPVPELHKEKYITLSSLERLLSCISVQSSAIELIHVMRKSAKLAILPKLLGKKSIYKEVEQNVRQALNLSVAFVSGFRIGVTQFNDKPTLVCEPLANLGFEFPLCEIYFNTIATELVLASKKYSASKHRCYFRSNDCLPAHQAFNIQYSRSMVMHFSQPYSGIEIVSKFPIKEHLFEYNQFCFASSLMRVMVSIFLDHTVTLDVASEVTRIPKRTIQRRLSNENLSFLEFRKTLVSNRALELLQEGRDITETAIDLHFSSVGHFSRFIKKLHGVSPTQWKEQTISRGF
ncbi:helix-turn-helix domain-containing protein [Vibrio crassostreae]|uniref:helix-turn-helix domain-containing protein n=1 Tax=Vibrio crassostreae TaxID=246167 RepID=UPI0010DB9415|nr:helix-turn-helix domain-containing protein [Vibrio crassostreae]TCN91228.1 AraC-like DNA-binding protein [Vibrio crassostreae]